MTTKNLQVTIPAHTWFAAKPLREDGFCLVSCAVAPGFEFDDFEIAGREDLLKQFGTSSENIQIIKMLTRT
jgi:predicted cupin superfamily sugar epimerase